MRITILTLGSRGDVQPFVALGIGLKQVGHQVTLCTSDRFRQFITDYGLNYAYMNDDLINLIDTDEGRAALESKGNPLRLLQQVKPIIRRSLDEAWAAAQGTEAIIYHPKALSGYHIAEKLEIPGFMSLPLPIYTPTTAFPCPIFPNLQLGGWYNKLTYQLLPLLAVSYVDVINQWRQECLGLPRRSWMDSELIRSDGRSVPVLYSYSSHVIPRPNDWQETTRATGYWFLDRPSDFSPPPALVDFLAAGKPPVCIGFGSMTGRNPEQLTEIVLAALKQTRQRGILLTGWGGLSHTDLPDEVFKLESIPHDWLFPQVAAVVHHGGAGTTAAVLRAGVPSIIVPFFGDQPFWGQRVAQLGVGSKPIPKKQLTVERLVATIEMAVSNQEMRDRSAALGQKIRAEDGVKEAVKVFHQYLASEFVPQLA
jgi:sterol 3beta-glucosyltransferase